MVMVGLYEYLALFIDADHIKRIRNDRRDTKNCIITPRLTVSLISKKTYCKDERNYRNLGNLGPNIN